LHSVGQTEARPDQTGVDDCRADLAAPGPPPSTTVGGPSPRQFARKVLVDLRAAERPYFFPIPVSRTAAAAAGLSVAGGDPAQERPARDPRVERDPPRGPPANYTFTAGDAGVHTFTRLVLHKKGKQKITITGTLNSSLTANLIVDVLE
jgi:hypothetical protein